MPLGPEDLLLLVQRQHDDRLDLADDQPASIVGQTGLELAGQLISRQVETPVHIPEIKPHTVHFIAVGKAGIL